MATNRGGKKREMSNLQIRLKQYDSMDTNKKSAMKRPGSNKK